MIKLENIVKIYNNGNSPLKALDGISFEVADNEMLAIMGASGCGKSTLLNILGGMDTATSGRYLYNGRDITLLDMDGLNKFRRDEVCFVFQNFALNSRESVSANVEIPLLAKHINRKQRNETVKNALNNVGLSALSGKKAGLLSGGEQQRCAIARAIASGNKLLLADEPTGSLDRKTSDEIMDMLSMLNKKGMTMIIVTHDEKVAERCDRIIRIEDGKII